MAILRKLPIMVVVVSLAACKPEMESPSVEQVRAARAATPRIVKVAKPILPPLDPPVVDVPRSAAGSLAQIGPAAIPALKQALLDSTPSVRRQAARALGKMGPDAEPALSELIAALEDSDPTVRDAAAQALGKIGPKAAPAIPALIKALEGPVPAGVLPEPDDS